MTGGEEAVATVALFLSNTVIDTLCPHFFSIPEAVSMEKSPFRFYFMQKNENLPNFVLAR